MIENIVQVVTFSDMFQYTLVLLAVSRFTIKSIKNNRPYSNSRGYFQITTEE